MALGNFQLSRSDVSCCNVVLVLHCCCTLLDAKIGVVHGSTGGGYFGAARATGPCGRETVERGGRVLLRLWKTKEERAAWIVKV